MSDCPYRDRRECGAGGGAAGVPYWYCLVRHDECEQMPDLLEECKVRLSSNVAVSGPAVAGTLDRPCSTIGGTR